MEGGEKSQGIGQGQGCLLTEDKKSTPFNGGQEINARPLFSHKVVHIHYSEC